MRVEQLDAYVWDSVRQLLAEPHRILNEWTRRGSEDGLVAELKAQRNQTNKLIGGQEQTLRRLADAYEAGALELDELTARTERIRARLRHAHDERAEIEARLAQTFELKEIAGRVDEFAARIRGSLDAADWTTRRQLIRTVVSRVEIGDGEVCVVYRVPGAPMPPNPGRDDGSSATNTNEGGDSSSNGDTSAASCSLRWNRPARLTGKRDDDLVAARRNVSRSPARSDSIDLEHAAHFPYVDIATCDKQTYAAIAPMIEKARASRATKLFRNNRLEEVAQYIATLRTQEQLRDEQLSIG